MRGVAAQLLHCPTCGTPYDLPLRAHTDECDEDFAFGFSLQPRAFRISRPPYVECPRGHMWTVAYVIRVDEYADEILLGEYIGGG